MAAALVETQAIEALSAAYGNTSFKPISLGDLVNTPDVDRAATFAALPKDGMVQVKKVADMIGAQVYVKHRAFLRVTPVHITSYTYVPGAEFYVNFWADMPTWLPVNRVFMTRLSSLQTLIRDGWIYIKPSKAHRAADIVVDFDTQFNADAPKYAHILSETHPLAEAIPLHFAPRPAHVYEGPKLWLPPTAAAWRETVLDNPTWKFPLQRGSKYALNADGGRVDALAEYVAHDRGERSPDGALCYVFRLFQGYEGPYHVSYCPAHDAGMYVASIERPALGGARKTPPRKSPQRRTARQKTPPKKSRR
jgi:hypothetical protein